MTQPTRRRAIGALAATGLELAARSAVGETYDRLIAGDVQLPSGPGYRARPDGAGPFPTVLVVADGGGGPGGGDQGGAAQEWVADVCRRLAKAGYLAVGAEPYAGAERPDAEAMRSLDGAVDWAGRNGGDLDRLGATGFGRGGRAIWLFAAHSPALKAAVAWSGSGAVAGSSSAAHPSTALDAASGLRAPLLGLYGRDDRSNPQSLLLQAETLAKAAGKTAEIVVYVGAGSDFATEGGPTYNQAAALDGWQRMIAWFKRYHVS